MTIHTPSDGMDEVLHAAEASARDHVPMKAPPMEIIEEPGAFLLACDLPGADREDIRVDVSAHRVVVATLPRTTMDNAFGGPPQRHPYLEFERAIPLPGEVRPEGAEARLNNGVLEVTLPKRNLGGRGVYRLPSL